VSPPRRAGDRGPRDLEELRARLSAVTDAAKTKKKVKKATAAAKKATSDPTPEDLTPDDDLAPDDDLRAEEPCGRWWEHEEVARPRPVVGGIAARTRRGPIGATWWSRRFLGSLESVMVGGRMERGRTYARKGQVVDLEITSGIVAATVQGSREEPYVVRLKMAAVPAEDWDRIVRSLVARAGYAARMLSGELPHEVEEVFESEGASLLPAPHARLVTECSCPDWENPCKHVAAVCYLLAEGFDRDPFSLLLWRGKGRDELLAQLRALRRLDASRELGAGPDPTAGAAREALGADEAPGADGAPGADVADDDDRDLLERFWVAGPALAHVRVLPEEAAVPAAALRLAPRGVIRVRGEDLVDALGPAYAVIAAAAAARARG